MPEDLYVDTNSPMTIFILSNLTPDTIYTITVAAVNGAGEGEKSDVIVVTTLAGLPVVENINTSVLQLGDDRTFTLGITRPSSINGPLR